MLYYIFLGLILFLISLLLYKAFTDKRLEIDAEIEEKTEHLLTLNEQIHHRSLDRGTGLTQSQINVLDKYERSNIRIPADILEELPYIIHLSESDTLDYIEHQRNHWKLENSKKVYKK